MTDYESLIAEVQQEHREQMTEIGRARNVRRGARPVRGIICKPFMHFGQPITMRQLAKRSGIPYTTLFRRKRQYGWSDADLVRPSRPSEHVNVEKLKQLASTGMKGTEYAKAVGLAPSSLRKALKRYGLYRTWQTARYSKCK